VALEAVGVPLVWRLSLYLKQMHMIQKRKEKKDKKEKRKKVTVVK